MLALHKPDLYSLFAICKFYFLPTVQKYRKNSNENHELFTNRGFVNPQAIKHEKIGGIENKFSYTIMGFCSSYIPC